MVAAKVVRVMVALEVSPVGVTATVLLPMLQLSMEIWTETEGKACTVYMYVCSVLFV